MEVGACAAEIDHGSLDLCRGPGDLDDDGFTDVLCADPEGYTPALSHYRGSPAGLVEGAAWATYPQWTEPPSYARRDADHDGDGLADLVIGWPDADVGQGGVLVYAGGTSDLQLAIPGQEPGRRLGDEVVTDLDLDEDGLPEIVTSASLPEEGTEEVRVFRGADRWGE